MVLWIALDRGYATPAPRMPIALTSVPILLCFLCRVPFLRLTRREGRIIPEGLREETVHYPDGRTELRLQAPNRWRSALLGTVILSGGLFAFLSLTCGLIGAFLDSEEIARFAVSEFLTLVTSLPAATAGLWLMPGPRVAWDRTRIWLNGVRFDRDCILKIAIVPAGWQGEVQVRDASRRGPSRFPLAPLWTASVLERLGYDIEFSEKPI